MFRTRQTEGFSLIELLISTAVLSIGLTMAIPTFQQLRANSQLRASSNTLLAEMMFARTQALKFGVQTIVCPSRDGLKCSRDAMWNEKRLIFFDRNRNRRLDLDEIVLRNHGALPSQITASSSRYRRQVRFQATGFSAGSNLGITICHKAMPHGRKLVVSNPGRARIQGTSCGGG